LVIFLIDNTIRLAMYSNRFLVKTMQMVGATRGFISKPMNIRAVINGLIASAIAIVLLWVSVMILETTVPVFKLLHDTKTMLLLFLAMIVIGISITYFSTQRSILKYLKMKLDDLY
jgi:cell division transport system permease protein